MLAIAVTANFLLSLVAERRKSGQCRVEKPAHPNAFAFAQLAHAIHSVVPVARTHQWKTVLAHAQAAIESSSAVLENRSGLSGQRRLRVRLLFFGFKQWLLEKGNYFIEDRQIASDVYVKCSDERKP